MQLDSNNIPLVADLDGTIISTDTLLESTIIAIRNNPLLIFILPFMIFKGKLFFKQAIDKYARCDAELLPYRYNVVDFLKEEKAKGRAIVLATATVKPIAEEIGKHLKIFDEIIATENINLRAEQKTKVLVEKFGYGGYDYIGDSKADLPVWKSSRFAIVVNKSNSLTNKAKRNGNVSKIFEIKKDDFNDNLKEIRVYQWIKNILIFLPLLMAHQIGDLTLIIQNFIAFFAFSFAASSVYVINDLFDIEPDRVHPRKRNRPIASGLISIPKALAIAFLLLALSILISVLYLPLKFILILITYLTLTTLYSFSFKRIYIIDIITLASLYTIRLIAGGASVAVEVSYWLLAFSMFLFLNLAIVKRYTELKQLVEAKKNKTIGRGYFVEDLSLLRSLGTSSGYLSVLVFALYVNSKVVLGLYNKPEFLWAVAPLLLFWITRIWFVAHRGKMHDDPIVFTAKDPVSYVVGFLVILLIIGAAI